MHPAIIQAAAAERTRDKYASSAARRQAAEFRRARRAERSSSGMSAGRRTWIRFALRAA